MSYRRGGHHRQGWSTSKAGLPVPGSTDHMELEKLASLGEHYLFTFTNIYLTLSISSYYCFVVQSLSRVQLFSTPWTAAHQASLSFTISRSLLKLRSIESVTPSDHLVLCELRQQAVVLLAVLVILPSIGGSRYFHIAPELLQIFWNYNTCQTYH